MVLMITGQIVDQSGDPLNAVEIVCNGIGYTPTVDFSVFTGPDGMFRAEVPFDWSGTLTPQLTNYTFEPASLTIPTMDASVTDANFIGQVISNYFTVVRSITSGVPGRTQAYRMVLQVTAADGVDQNIFLYQRMLVDAATNEMGDFFVAVCSPSDIQEYPVSEPNPESDRPYFRLNSVDLLFRNADLMSETWTAMQADFAELARALRAINQLQEEDERTFTF